MKQNNQGNLFMAENIWYLSPQICVYKIFGTHSCSSDFRLGRGLAVAMKGEWKCRVLLLPGSTCPFLCHETSNDPGGQSLFQQMLRLLLPLITAA